jgi:LIVCS family branched-chain amino acid:cation transporter
MSLDTTQHLDAPKQKVNIFLTGMALFSMFFGAGNIVFPLILGRISGNETPFTILGFVLSAVAFPFLGLIAMMLYGGDLSLFLKRLGKWPAFAFLLIFQLTQGPVGCMPRLVTLMHASIKPYFPEISLLLGSILICTIIFLLTFRPQKIVDLLGTILTPVLLGSLAILILFGMLNAPEVQTVTEGSTHYFLSGMKGGYQTMDLIGALLFATVILPHLSQGLSSFPKEAAKKIIQRRMVKASLIAAALLMVTYIGLCSIASHHALVLHSGVAPEELFQTIAVKILGTSGGVIAAIAIFLACLTTAISLAAIFSQYLRENLCKNKISPLASLIITLLVTGMLANLGFAGIAKFVGPVLEILYPSVIILCVFNIAYSLYRVEPIQTPVFFTLGLAIGGIFL